MLIYMIYLTKQPAAENNSVESENFSKSAFWKLYKRKKLWNNLMCNPRFL